MNKRIPISNEKQKAQNSWRATDYARFATCLEYGLTNYVTTLPIVAQQQVLDVACGAGNLSLQVAWLGAIVTGIDFNPDALDVARTRAAEAKLAIQFDEGDIEQMKYPSNTFDWGISIFGIMFAIHADLAAQELIRVCKSNGNIAITSWTSESLVGQLAQLLARYRPASPGTARTSNWGDEHHVRKYLEWQTRDLQVSRRLWRFKFPYGPSGVVDFFRQYSSSHKQVFDLLPEADATTLHQDLEQVWHNANLATDGTTIADAEYLDVRAVVHKK
ncbi:MAG: class I SAM-dependent methyltransferase [Chloroflexota bacterium]